MKTKRNKRVLQKRTTHAAKSHPKSQPFTAHLLELRRRLTWVGVSVVLGASAAYGVQQHIVSILLRPAGKQQFIYTSPGGGLNFLVQICIYTGVLVSIPVIIYNVLKFIDPVMPGNSTRYIFRGSAVAGVLAIMGVLCGYFFGLPSALKFLSHQFTTTQIHALISVQSYLSFVTMSLLASAFIFQAPLLMLLINRIKPLKPGTLMQMKIQRWVVVGSFILGALISPTADIRPMVLLAAPMIISYEVGVALVWQVNHRRRKPKKLLTLLEQDAFARAERLQRLQSAFVMQFEQPVLVPAAVAVEAESEAESEPVVMEPVPVVAQQVPLATLSGGRTNYQFNASRQIHRRIML